MNPHSRKPLFFAILIGFLIAGISPLATLGAELCARKDAAYVMGLAFFAIAAVSSFPGFISGWLMVNVLHVESWLFDLGAVYLTNWLIYAFLIFRIKMRRRVDAG